MRLPSDDPPLTETVETLVRISLLIRLVILAIAVVALTVRGYGWNGVVILTTLSVTSYAGLHSPRLRRLVARHPIIALPDVALVTSIPLLIGIDSPVSLVAITSALLIGVVFPFRSAVPMAALLLSPYVAVVGGPVGGDPVQGARMGVILTSVVAMGMAFRRVSATQRRTEQEAALARSAEAAANERLRLARDLHDTVAKACQGVALTASALPGWIDRDVAVARRQASSIAEGARDAVAAARALMTSLRLDDPARPLPEVLEDLVHQATRGRVDVVDHELHDLPGMSEEVRHELVLAAAEALENVARHAAGAGLCVRLEPVGLQAVLTVRDDGPGFDPGRERASYEGGRYGLRGMRERMASVGGTAEISSAPGQGTVVTLTAPVGRTPTLAPAVPTPRARRQRRAVA